MGPPSDYSSCRTDQGAACECRQRFCLLKGCEAPFHPPHPLSRYCRDECRRAARAWSQWQANQRYRASEQGKGLRREQSQRWRARARQRRSAEDSHEAASPTGGEGYHHWALDQECFCPRPGCYEGFTRTRRSPLQKFCGHSCRLAFWRVLQRESRWRCRWGLPPLVVKIKRLFRRPLSRGY